MFEIYLEKWGLTPDGETFATRSSSFLPVRRSGVPAMLKIALSEEERRGGALMSLWNGEGAARVLARDGTAILLERAESGRSLATLARSGQDDEASRLICAIVAKLHAVRIETPERLCPLSQWFQELEPAAARHRGNIAEIRRP